MGNGKKVDVWKRLFSLYTTVGKLIMERNRDPVSVADHLQQIVSGDVGCWIIDLDADPFIPEGWVREEHKKGGKWKFDSKQVKLHLSEGQTTDDCVVVGHKLRLELANVPVMNANLLDWYLAHPEFIPEEWKGKAVFFWGTVYRGSGGSLYVRYLCFHEGHWQADYRWLDHYWRSSSPALVSQVST